MEEATRDPPSHTTATYKPHSQQTQGTLYFPFKFKTIKIARGLLPSPLTYSIIIPQSALKIQKYWKE